MFEGLWRWRLDWLPWMLLRRSCMGGKPSKTVNGVNRCVLNPLETEQVVALLITSMRQGYLHSQRERKRGHPVARNVTPCLITYLCTIRISWTSVEIIAFVIEAAIKVFPGVRHSRELHNHPHYTAWPTRCLLAPTERGLFTTAALGRTKCPQNLVASVVGLACP